MSIRALEAFHAVVTLGSVAAAAEQLHVTQPAVSHMLKSLADATGLTLFRKQGRRLVLTEDGQVFFNDVSSALNVLSGLQASAKSIRSARTGNVRLGAIPVVADHILPDLLGCYMKNNSDIGISLEVVELHRAINLLDAGSIDIAILSGSPPDHFKVHAAFPGNTVLVAPPGHFEEEQAKISLSDIQEAPFIALSAGSPFRYALDQHLAAHNLSLNIRAQFRTQSAIAGLVAAGAGISILDRSVVAKRRFDVQVLEFGPPLQWSFQLLTRKTGILSTAAEHLIEFLQIQFARQTGPQ
ncbi:LysR family transcriptional regulator [Hoeflea sp. TYP-13]|uniref:LysR family transcriptional regulator n=1 Tax=Hoeflea sp. TYP-13 TaxID=3230023 RepID=UPI0034C681D2